MSASHREFFGEAVWRELAALAPVLHRPARTVLLRQGEPPHQVFLLAVGSVLARLAATLLRLAESMRGPALDLTQADLAQLTGASRNAVGAALQALRADGALSLSRGTVTLLDQDVLHARACAPHRPEGHPWESPKS